MTAHFDSLETRSADEREEALIGLLQAQIANARSNAPAFAELLRGVDPASITSRAALAALPVLRKPELLARQRAGIGGGGFGGGDVFGGFATVGWGDSSTVRRRAAKVFASPGPIYEPEVARADYWRMARALFAAGFREGDLVHNSFSYHFTPAGSMMENAALAIGCTVFPAGIGQSEQQVNAMAELEPQAYAGTPSFLKMLLEKADEMGVAFPSLAKASVSGEAFPGALKAWMAERGVDAYENYGTADLGLVAYETPAREGLVVDEGVLLEIVRPGTGEPAAEGEVGEVVVTTFNPDYPLIRYGTGDLSAVLPGTCPTGRTNMRIRGWLGRADQSAKVRGMFVHPSQVAEIARRHVEIRKARLVVAGATADDQMTLEVEVDSPAPEGLAERIVASMREVTKLRGAVALHPPGTLPKDGLVIEDLRRPG